MCTCSEKYIKEVFRDKRHGNKRRYKWTAHPLLKLNVLVDRVAATLSLPSEISGQHAVYRKIHLRSLLKTKLERTRYSPRTEQTIRDEKSVNSSNKTRLLSFSVLGKSIIVYEKLCRRNIVRKQLRSQEKLQRMFFCRFYPAIEKAEFRHRIEMIQLYISEIAHLKKSLSETLKTVSRFIF